MKHLFLDSQIWLSLYDFSNDDLRQFSKLNDLIGSEIQVYLTRQVYDEVYRNRENKINEALKKFKDINPQVPNLCKGYTECEEFESILKKFRKSHENILKKVKEDIEKENLHADTVISSIFLKLEIHERDDDLINKSVFRYKIGNPPGKNNSYGDAINWELLLKEVPNGEDLFFVSSDKDFRSVLNENKFNNFLKKEWIENKNITDIFLQKFNRVF